MTANTHFKYFCIIKQSYGFLCDDIILDSIRDAWTDLMLYTFLVGNRNNRDVQSKCLYYAYGSNSAATAPASDLGTVIENALLPVLKDGYSRIVIVSDTHDKHSYLTNLPKCDLFIHAGDILLTSRNFSYAREMKKLADFNVW